MTASTLTPVTWSRIQQMLGLMPAPAAVKAPVPIPNASASLPNPGLAELLKRQCKDGERTQTLTQLAGTLLAAGYTEADCIAECIAWNKRNIEPLDEDKVTSTCVSICKSDQVNHPERYAHLRAFEPLFDLKSGRIDHYLTSTPPARRWLVKDMIVVGKVGAIIAPGGSSKSQWLLQLAVSVATGIPLAGHWEMGEKGSVLVFFAEDDNDEIHRRLKRVTDHLTMIGQGAAMAGMEDRLLIYSTVGTDTLLTKRQVTGEVTATDVIERILAMASQVEELRLIVIDPGSRFRGGDENKNEDATRFVEALEALAKRTGSTVLIAHHTNKSAYSPDAEPGQGASRGASALTDGLRWQMNLSKPNREQAGLMGLSKDDQRNYVAATVTKTNYSAFPAPVIMERLSDGYLEALTAAQAQQRSEQEAIVRVLQTVSNERKPLSARSLEELHGGVGGRLQLPKQAVRQVVKMAIERGLLAGGARKPLSVTLVGQAILASASTELATRREIEQPPEKTQ
jgi:RecA-family ATPase